MSSPSSQVLGRGFAWPYSSLLLLLTTSLTCLPCLMASSGCRSTPVATSLTPSSLLGSTPAIIASSTTNSLPGCSTSATLSTLPLSFSTPAPLPAILLPSTSSHRASTPTFLGNN